jgi:hypothetical protein
LEKYHSNDPILIETYDDLIFNLFNGGNYGLSFDVLNNKYLNLKKNKNDI